MNLPAHPQRHDDQPATTPGRRRVVMIAIAAVIVLASIHFIRAALT